MARTSKRYIEKKMKRQKEKSLKPEFIQDYQTKEQKSGEKNHTKLKLKYCLVKNMH